MAAFTTAFLIGLAAASATTSAVGSIKAGRASKRAGEAERDAANAQADLADTNAAVADRQAADAIARGAEEERRFRDTVAGIVGAQRAGFAASNVDVGSGSALLTQRDAEHLGNLDALQIRSNAEREARGFRDEGVDLRQRAVIARRTGVYAEAAGRAAAGQHYAGAVSTILGTTASLVEARYGFGGSAGRRRANASLVGG